MKNFRVDFSKGINVVGDKSVIGPGWTTVAENVDLRSGMPRAIRGPQFFSTVPAGTTRAFEYRGKWYFSSRWRDYETEYINGRDRVYFTESGESKIGATLNLPSKIIEGTEVPLGTKRPQTPPYISSSEAITPIVTVAVSSTGGGYAASQTTSFRMATKTDQGLSPLCSSKFTQFGSETNTNSVVYTWRPVTEALGYVIFIGSSQGTEQKVVDLGWSETTYTDVGVVQGNGEFASNYDVTNPYSYVYTFQREVNTVQDESAPSDSSLQMDTSRARHIVFNTLSDGFFNNPNTISVSSPTITDSQTYAGSITISSAIYLARTFQTKVTTATPHGLVTGDKAYFTGTGNANWDGVVHKIISDSTNPNVLYVKYVKPFASGTGTLIPAKTRLTFTASSTIYNGDAVYFPATPRTENYLVYSATSCTANGCEINAFTSADTTVSGIKYLPHNGYITHRNLYRLGDTSEYALVARVPVTIDFWDDYASYDRIEATPLDSYYIENNKTVIYDVPPQGMTSLTAHYGMMFGVDGNSVRWTPTGRPDAWPQIFAIQFPYKPLALASWGQSLIVLCYDSVYRIDGNIPTQLSLGKTEASDGCIAPHSVQKTSHGLVYLSKRGIMLFDGSRAQCISDSRIPNHFFMGPSSLDEPIDYWWHPTMKGYNYANLAHSDGIGGFNAASFRLNDTNIINGPDYAARSFYHLGKYYLYWTEDDNYEAHTCVCVDLQALGMPITTIGMKAIDTHVDNVGQVYVLAGDTHTGDLKEKTSNFIQYEASQSKMSLVDFSPSGTIQPYLFTFLGNDNYRVPYHIRLGDNPCDQPLMKKKFRDVRFYAAEERGTLHIRIYIDGRYICDGESTVANNPNKIRQVNIPSNRCMGYNIDVEFSGEVPLRGVTVTYDALEGVML